MYYPLKGVDGINAVVDASTDEKSHIENMLD
jgi:hypothetical protein